MRTFLLTLLSSSVFAEKLTMPTNARCLPGSSYHGGGCKPIECESGALRFGFDVDGKEPCCVQCKERQNLCLKPLTHTVTDIHGNSGWSLEAVCDHIDNSGSNCTVKDDCVTVDGKEAWYGCNYPEWLNGSTVIDKPSTCWDHSDLVSSGSRLNFGIVGVVGVLGVVTNLFGSTAL